MGGFRFPEAQKCLSVSRRYYVGITSVSPARSVPAFLTVEAQSARMAITPTRNGPKTKRIARDRLYRLMFDWSIEDDFHFLQTARRHVPEAWHVLEMDIDVEEPKQKVTLYLNRSVVRMFQQMGKGYHARINRVLETWVQMKIAEMKAIEMDQIAAIKAARIECEAEEPEDQSERQIEELHDHWAYLQGVIDTEAKLAKRKGSG